MIGITHKRRLEQIDNNLEAIYREMLDGYYEDDSLQAAVDCQVEINSIVWKLNRLKGNAYRELHIAEWIPVTERMPDIGELVLITQNRGDGDKTVETAYLTSDGPNDLYWSIELFKSREIDEVLAWMPLPEPYEEVER